MIISRSVLLIGGCYGVPDGSKGVNTPEAYFAIPARVRMRNEWAGEDILRHDANG